MLETLSKAFRRSDGAEMQRIEVLLEQIDRKLDALNEAKT